MSTARTAPSAELVAEIGLRLAEKPAIVPACRNCAQFACDHDDRETWKGVSFRRVRIRCKRFGIRVILDNVCNQHAWRHPDRRDV